MTEGTRERRSRERDERALAWTFTGLAAIVAAGVIWLFFANDLDDTYLLFSGVGGLCFPVVGVTVLTRQPGHTIGWIFLAIGTGMSLVGFANGYAAYSLTVLPGPLPATGVVAWLSGWLWVPSFGLLMTFALLLFPDGRLPSARWRPVAYLAAGSIAATMADFAVTSWLDPYASVYAPQTVGSPVVGVWFGLLSASGLASAASLVVRFRRSRSEERLQLKWVAYAAAVTVAIVVPAVAVTRGASPSLIIVVAAPLVPVAAGVAILRYRLYDVDLVINRTLVYGLLTALLVAVYLGGVVVSQYVFRALTGGESQLAIVTSTLVIAALFNPLRRRVQGFVDRRFYRKIRRREDPGRLQRPVASRDGPQLLKRRRARGGDEDRAASPRLSVAAPRCRARGKESRSQTVRARRVGPPPCFMHPSARKAYSTKSECEIQQSAGSKP